MIALENCKDRYLYKIASRNLAYGVFDITQNGFIGIREKFGSRYLFVEYHWDTGEPFGTVSPIHVLDPLPENIACCDELGTLDKLTGRPFITKFESLPDGTNKRHKFFTDVEPYEAIPESQETHGVIIHNDALFDWLDSKEKEYAGLQP